MSDSEEEFEEQLRLEKLEAQQAGEDREVIEHGRVRTDEDGTEFEWDSQKKAWFPKINADFIANYQMNYGSHKQVEKDNAKPEVHSDPDAYWKHYYGGKAPDTSDPNYAAWYAYYYGGTASQEAPDFSDPSYPSWYYKQCYGVAPDETNAEYKEWRNQLQSATSTAPACAEDKGNATNSNDIAGKSSAEEEVVKNKPEEAKEKDASAKDGGDEKNSAEPNAKKKKPDPKWFDQEDSHNSSVYVQGLPDDITEDEFKDTMTKFGLIAYDYEKKKLKLKLYMDKGTGKPKGDGLCTYIKRESVDLAIQMLDESTIRGSKIEVQLAEFKLKGHFDPTLRRKPKNNKAKRREKEKQAKLLDWRPDKLPDERYTCEKTVVLRNLFEPHEFDTNPAAIQEVREDMRQECSKFGDIKKISIFDRNADGVITVVYKEFEAADLCVSSLNHRWFGGRRVLATNWNGKEKFEVKETPEQEAERLRKWDEYLATGGEASKENGASGKSAEEVANKGEADESASNGSQMST